MTDDGELLRQRLALKLFTFVHCWSEKSETHSANRRDSHDFCIPGGAIWEPCGPKHLLAVAPAFVSLGPEPRHRSNTRRSNRQRSPHADPGAWQVRHFTFSVESDSQWGAILGATGCNRHSRNLRHSSLEGIQCISMPYVCIDIFHTNVDL